LRDQTMHLSKFKLWPKSVAYAPTPRGNGVNLVCRSRAYYNQSDD